MLDLNIDVSPNRFESTAGSCVGHLWERIAMWTNHGVKGANVTNSANLGVCVSVQLLKCCKKDKRKMWIRRIFDWPVRKIRRGHIWEHNGEVFNFNKQLPLLFSELRQLSQNWASLFFKYCFFPLFTMHLRWWKHSWWVCSFSNTWLKLNTNSLLMEVTLANSRGSVDTSQSMQPFYLTWLLEKTCSFT